MRIEDFEEYGIRAIRLGPKGIALGRYDGERQSYPVRRVSFTARKNSESGGMVIFYGPESEQSITKKRLQVYFGPKQKITVQEIVPIGWGENAWFDVGEFVKVTR